MCVCERGMGMVERDAAVRLQARARTRMQRADLAEALDRAAGMQRGSL